MAAFLKAIFGKGNRSTSVMGAGAVLTLLGTFLMTGEVNKEALGVATAFVAGGLGLARGGGTGSDTPAAP